MSDDIHASSAAYALDALPDDERAAFEAHLETCSTCQHEVARFAATASRLGAAGASQPPPGLREAVLSQLPSTRQLPAYTSASGPRPGSRALSWLLAAAALLLVVTGGAAVSQHNRASRLEVQSAQVSAVLAAPDAVTEHDDLANPASLTVVTSRELNRAVVVVSDLPQLKPDQTYQMWWIDQQGPHSAGLMGAPPPHQSAAVVVDAVQDAREFAITLEPAGGSKAPTTKPVVGARLA